MAITDKVYVKNHRQLASQLDTNLPRSAFAGATLDRLFAGEDLTALDDATRDRVLDFTTDFLDCTCQQHPHCGHPERKFVRYLLDLRASGLDPEAIIATMTDDYMVFAYPGDVRSFLDEAVRQLEAIEDIARVDGHEATADAANQRRDELLG